MCPQNDHRAEHQIAAQQRETHLWHAFHSRRAFMRRHAVGSASSSSARSSICGIKTANVTSPRRASSQPSRPANRKARSRARRPSPCGHCCPARSPKAAARRRWGSAAAPCETPPPRSRAASRQSASISSAAAAVIIAVMSLSHCPAQRAAPSRAQNRAAFFAPRTGHSLRLSPSESVISATACAPM